MPVRLFVHRSEPAWEGCLCKEHSIALSLNAATFTRMKSQHELVSSRRIVLQFRLLSQEKRKEEEAPLTSKTTNALLTKALAEVWTAVYEICTVLWYSLRAGGRNQRQRQK